MEATTLFQIFTASFSPDPNVRITAELELRKLEPQEGLVPTLLQLISPSPSSTPAVRLAAAIYLKNRISSSWRPPPPASVMSTLSPSARYTAIPPSDRQALKTNILPLLAALSRDEGSNSVKLQLSSVLGKVIDSDFPEEWPGLVNEVGALLHVSGEGEVEAGLRATVEVLRTFRWVDSLYHTLRRAWGAGDVVSNIGAYSTDHLGRYSRKDPESRILGDLVVHLFPQLHKLAQNILASQPTTAAALNQQGTLLHLVLKSYKNSISTTLTPAQQDTSSLVPWGQLFLAITTHSLPIELLPADDEDREKHPWSKAKKWAVHSLNRLFMRYGSPSQLASNMKVPYGKFADLFVRMFAPGILETYLGMVTRSVGGEWVPSKVKHHMLVFFEECIKPLSTWELLKPHVQPLLEQFVFPLVCLTEDEIELFTDDPPEFARTHFGDFIEDSYANPTSTSLCFISALVESRKKITLMPMLNFIQTAVSKYPAETTPRQKDGALRMLASLALSTSKSQKKIAPMMESFFVAFVLPEFKSPHGFLRYRACEVVEKFESCDMTWENKANIEGLCSAVMEAITDTDLPVRIQAAITLPELARYEDKLLKLANEVDLDTLTNTTRSLCAEFSEEVIPFAVELTQQLIGSYSRLVRESHEIREKQEQMDSYDGGFDDEKTLVCMNLLKTIEQLVSSLAKNPESLARVEELVTPALLFTVQNNLVELYDETFEILDSLTFYNKSIGPAMWPLFEAAFTSFKTGGADYFQEMFPFFDNVVSYGAPTLATNSDYRSMLVDLFVSAMTSSELGADDRCVACKIGEAMLLNLRGNIDEAIPPIVERAMTFVVNAGNEDTDKDFVITVPLFLHSLELVITSIYYNPALTLAILDRHDWTQQFFSLWFKHLHSYSRVHDRKLGIAAICALFEWLASVGDAPLAHNASQLLGGALQLFKGLPEAIVEREEYIKTLEEADDDEEEDEDIDDVDEEDDGAAEGDVHDATNEYLDMLARRETDVSDDEDDDAASTWSEEVTWVSPLDSIDMYERFTATLRGLESGSPALFQLATQPLTAPERTDLEAVARNALAGGEKAATAALRAPISA
ncbi:hypothetical protein P7C70_g2895, partial [Phenoliferia sp. Uapishka_3]